MKNNGAWFRKIIVAAVAVFLVTRMNFTDFTTVAIVGGVLLLLGILGLFRNYSINKNQMPAKAEVVKIEVSTGRNKYDNVYMEFCDESGQKVTARNDTVRGEYKIGDKIDIIYMRNRPTKTYFSVTQTVFLSIIISLIGLSLSAWSVANWVFI